jgi:hypothetical protein
MTGGVPLDSIVKEQHISTALYVLKREIATVRHRPARSVEVGDAAASRSTMRDRKLSPVAWEKNGRRDAAATDAANARLAMALPGLIGPTRSRWRSTDGDDDNVLEYCCCCLTPLSCAATLRTLILLLPLTWPLSDDGTEAARDNCICCSFCCCSSCSTDPLSSGTTATNHEVIVTLHAGCL